MKIETKEIGKSNKEITVEMETEKFQKYLEQAAAALSKTHSVKGFRPGNAPLHVIEETVGTEALYREAAIGAIEATYTDVLEAEKIEVIGEPQFDILKIAKGNLFVYKATVTVMPEITLPDYRALAQSVNKEKGEEIAVSEAEVTQTLEWLEKSRRPKTEEGKEESPTVPIDDAFAKSLGSFETLEDVKKNIRDGLTQEKELQNKEAKRSKLIKAISEKVKLDIPEILLTRQMDELKQEFEANLSRMNMTREDYLKGSKKSEKDIEKEFEAIAREKVQVGLVLREIARKENISVTEEEVTEEANKFLGRFESAEEAGHTIDPHRLRAYTKGVLENEKVFQLLETL